MTGEGVARRSVDFHRDGTTNGPNELYVKPQHTCDHPTCGARLDKADRPCPFGPHEVTA